MSKRFEVMDYDQYKKSKKTAHKKIETRNEELKESKSPYTTINTYDRVLPSVEENKLEVFLDLDNTVICSLEFDEDLKYFPKELQEKLIYKDFEKLYRIFQRPHLQEFLDYLFQNYSVSVWTAADLDYAEFIIHNFIEIKPNRKLKYTFWGYHTNRSEEIYKSPKDLRLLWDAFSLKDLKPCNTVIIDDLHDVYNANKDNCVHVQKFWLVDDNHKVNLNAVHDSYLLQVVKKLDKKKEKFHIKPCHLHHPVYTLDVNKSKNCSSC